MTFTEKEIVFCSHSIISYFPFIELWELVQFLMAGIAGLEPTPVGIKILCLTTWLYPNTKGFVAALGKECEPSAAGP